MWCLKSGCLEHVLLPKVFRNYSTRANTFDVAIIGGGIVGLATARELILRYPKFKFAVLEKEAALGIHQSGHNSGVIHAGIYYAPGSLKAKLCVEGMKKSYEYLEAHKVPYKKCGKLIVAVNELEVPRLDELYSRSQINGVPNVSFIAGDKIKEIEPNCVGVKAIYSPETGIVDWRTVALSYAEDFAASGGVIYKSFRSGEILESCEDVDYPVLIKNNNEPRNSNHISQITCKYVITCAGLQSDRVAKATGCSPHPAIMPFRGDYLVLKPEKSSLVNGNIYPVPDPNFPFLGVHFTPRMDGSIWLGPSAILSFDREGYGRFSFNFRDSRDAIFYPGFRKLAHRYLYFGFSEILNGIFIGRQVKQLQLYVPSLNVKDVTRGSSGIRAQAVNPNGTLVDDFVIHFGDSKVGERVMHVRNAPSPAATASLAIGRVLADKAQECFSLPLGEPRNFV
ncbi:hypothetical protein MN116_005689 [Schistosoma mekongi]|uniref:L-2-hydroxyglutarate dehydrogenase, mitochondrial n=1 Tax=Schistosoma mekongi TaxID=38744 RepID=A0AAE1ZB10_SCHME|nr:hypothetical protein MN116_005689 [Schistosoma mekongi]